MHEYMSVPKRLFRLDNPLELIKHICIGIPIKSHVPSDAAHFLTETLQFLASYRNFANLQTVTLDVDPSWRTADENEWGCMNTKDDTVEALKEVLAENPIYFNDEISLAGRQ
jgi:hypothetical protein